MPVSEADNILFAVNQKGSGPSMAGYDGLKPGVEASHQMAAADMEALSRFDERFDVAGEKFDLPPALLAGIASRESRGGTWIEQAGENAGDNGDAYGIMQVDAGYHQLVPVGPDNGSQGHINQAASILDWFRDEALSDNPGLSEAHALLVGTAAYNAGPDVYDLSLSRIDTITDEGDYSGDVWARAQYIAEHWDML